MVCFIITVSVFMPAAQYAEANEKKEENDMQAYVDAMQPGWNLGNTFDATGSETSWGNPATTKELIDQLVKEGYKSIRIPITWNHRMGAEPDYVIDEAFLKRIQEVVDWSLDAGLYVMINMHHDSHWMLDMESYRDQVLIRFKAAWIQIAEHFKDYPDKLMFEGINEPRFSEDWGRDEAVYFEMLHELNASFHEVVRQSGGLNDKRPLVLSTLTASAAQKRLDELGKTIEQLNDKRIIATVHYYGFYPFSVNLAGVTTFNDEARNDLIQTFDRVHDTFVAKGIPVIVGEFGLLGFDKAVDMIEQGEKLKYFDYLGYYAKQKRLTTMLWDNGQHFDRRSLAWKDPELYAVMKAAWDGRSSNASTDLIYVKKDAAVTDQTITLQLNGNEFSELRIGERVLTKGADYELIEDKLTIKASLIESLLTQDYGEQSVITAKFSAGADWNVKLMYYNTPTLRSAEGTDSGFSIPTAFKGDRLATMEAVYADGGSTRPNDWTPYKEMGHSYKPNYDMNEIMLTKEFLTELRDGEIKLNMHFWSGEIVEYTITKEQSKIVGVSSNEPETETGGTEAAGEPSPSPEPTAGGDTAAPAIAAATEDSEESSGKKALLAGGAIVSAMLIAAAGWYVWRNKHRRNRQGN